MHQVYLYHSEEASVDRNIVSFVSGEVMNLIDLFKGLFMTLL